MISDAASYLPVVRFLCIGALSLLLAGAAFAGTGSHAPLALGGMLESHGAADLGTAPGNGELLRFIPRSQFQIGVLLENKTGSRLVVTEARVLEPSRTLVHQIGTRFHPWNPPTCPPGALCPAYVFGLKGGRSRPHPFAVAPGKDVGVELDFQLGTCAQIPGANPAPLSRLRVAFRTPGGKVRHHTLPLGGAELHLRMPKPADCFDPRSSLSVDGPSKYQSSDWWTIPGSNGDVCTRRNGELDFVSRRYQTEISRPFAPSHWERVMLHMDRFRGTGTYARGTVTLVADRKKVFRAHDPVLHVTTSTTREVIATIDAGRPPSGTTRGIPFHITGTLRCHVTG